MAPRPRRKDWHRAEIWAALRMTPEGWNFTSLGRAHGYSNNAVSETCNRPWPAVEKVIADALGMTPQEIWPSRYDEDGQPKQGLPISKNPPRPRRRSSPSSLETV